MANMPGGWSKTRAADAEIQKICDQVKDQVEKKTGKKYGEFKGVAYIEQIVAGANYVIKVDVGGVNNLHVSLFRALPCNGGEIKVLRVEEDETKDDPLVPF